MDRNHLRTMIIHFNNSYGVPECYEMFFENDTFDDSNQLDDQEQDIENDSFSTIRKVRIGLDSDFGVPTCYSSIFQKTSYIEFMQEFDLWITEIAN